MRKNFLSVLLYFTCMFNLPLCAADKAVNGLVWKKANVTYQHADPSIKTTATISTKRFVFPIKAISGSHLRMVVGEDEKRAAVWNLSDKSEFALIDLNSGDVQKHRLPGYEWREILINRDGLHVSAKVGRNKWRVMKMSLPGMKLIHSLEFETRDLEFSFDTPDRLFVKYARYKRAFINTQTYERSDKVRISAVPANQWGARFVRTGYYLQNNAGQRIAHYMAAMETGFLNSLPVFAVRNVEMVDGRLMHRLSLYRIYDGKLISEMSLGEDSSYRWYTYLNDKGMRMSRPYSPLTMIGDTIYITIRNELHRITCDVRNVPPHFYIEAEKATYRVSRNDPTFEISLAGSHPIMRAQLASPLLPGVEFNVTEGKLMVDPAKLHFTSPSNLRLPYEISRKIKRSNYLRGGRLISVQAFDKRMIAYSLLIPIYIEDATDPADSSEVSDRIKSYLELRDELYQVRLDAKRILRKSNK